MRRLKTVRRPPIYPNEPSHLPCSSLTHPAAVLTPSIGVLRWIRAKGPQHRLAERLVLPSRARADPVKLAQPRIRRLVRLLHDRRRRPFDERPHRRVHPFEPHWAEGLTPLRPRDPPQQAQVQRVQASVRPFTHDRLLADLARQRPAPRLALLLLEARDLPAQALGLLLQQPHVLRDRIEPLLHERIDPGQLLLDRFHLRCRHTSSSVLLVLNRFTRIPHPVVPVKACPRAEPAPYLIRGGVGNPSPYPLP